MLAPTAPPTVVAQSFIRSRGTTAARVREAAAPEYPYTECMGTIPRTALLALACLAVPSLVTAQVPAVDLIHETDPSAQVLDRTFRHDRHAQFQCLECHTMDDRHGGMSVQETSDCRACHHAGERLEQGCATCHDREDLGGVVFPLELTFDLTVRDDVLDRNVGFDHADHAERECVECHVQGPSLAIPQLDCRTCHEEHHQPTNDGCMNCHRQAPEGAHTLEVHASCSGSGCHTQPPVEEAPRTRVGCLWCHEDQVEHETEGNCVDCHIPGQAGVRGGGT